MMTSSVQHENWIAKIMWHTVSSALVLVALLAPTIIATPSAQAQTYTVLHTFRGGKDGSNPQAGLVGDATGNLYGTTYAGGTYGVGTVFKVSRTGKERSLYIFTAGADGSSPAAGLLRDPAGNLYGTTRQGGDFGYGAVFKVNPNGNQTVLHSFTGVDGSYPYGGLVRDPVGNIYGTTFTGGASGFGTVFKLDTAGNETVLHSFTGADGMSPLGGLVRDPVGNLYGTTAAGGGDPMCAAGNGCGIVFKLDKTGKETVLHVFNMADGSNPLGALIRDAAGNLYGTTANGGDLTCNAGFGCGTVFKLDANGAETVIYTFTGGADGAAPFAGLARDPAGNLYGSTYFGGDLTCSPPSGCGTIFKVDTIGAETVLHSFTGLDGGHPYASVIRDPAGNLYGTTSRGGDLRCNHPNGCGVVFKITP